MGRKPHVAAIRIHRRGGAGVNQRELPAGMADAVQAGLVRPIMFIFGDFEGDPVRICTGQGAVTWQGETWHGMGEMLSLSSMTESTDSNSQTIAVKLTFPAELLDPVAAGAFVDRASQFWLALVDDDGAISDGWLLFSGRMDSDSVEDDGAMASVTIKVVSEIDDQLKPRVFRYTHEDQQTLYPGDGDLGFAYVAALQDINIQWGK